MELIQSLADFEKMPEGPEIGVKTIHDDLQRGAVFVKLAFQGIKCAGMVLYYLAYSSWQGQCIHMEDLYVRPEFQRQGLAKLFVKSLAKEAAEKGYKRINWNVLNWNTPARDFYKTLKAADLSESEGWLLYRLEEKNILALANEP
ncbi:N-acetyltransferase domain-containing protein [Aphelenchoides bicaudatus]|nr:N-acetyltransferase domain-containing protein [Aphelenchoides bicaudatus]